MALTIEQLEAVNKDGSNIIVSAGAGSGKTAVLSKRVIRKLQDGININELLILTFTNEAASEMKTRIRKEIKANNLKEQLNYLDSAYITTFDSFALSIVKKYHYLLNIPENIQIIDNSLITIYKNKMLDNILNNMYDDPSFNNLINSYCIKDDKNIQEYILESSNILDNLLDKEEYLNTYIMSHYTNEYIDSLVNKYLSLIKQSINELLNKFDAFSSHITKKLYDKLVDYFTPLFGGKTYEDYYLFTTKEPVRFTGVDESGTLLKEEIKSLIEEIKSYLRYSNTNEIKEELLSTKTNQEIIIDIIKKLDENLLNYKKSLNSYEFNDIAHMAISIVKNNPDIKKELKESFNEIMLDEYQDTSIIQEEFINLISNNNVYMVGDIKQSIYRFRNANPYIFQKKYDAYSKNNGGVKIDLLKNFRSRKEVLFNINEIFNLIMDNDLGDANYLESHNMVYGNTSYDIEDPKHNNNLEIYNYSLEEDSEYTKEEKEIFIIAEDILSKINNNYLVFDKNTSLLRPITYSDICIIPDRNKNLELYKKVLEYLGIPSTIYMDEILTNNIVINVLNNLITLVYYINNNINNSKFTYKFISIARSFLFNYKDQEIYTIVSNKTYSNTDIYTIAKSININNPLNKILNDILEKYSFYDKLTSLSDIDKNIIRINNLLDISKSLESLGYNLEDFVAYLSDIKDFSLNIKYSAKSANSNSVKLMNIHKSKGLEFPVCYFPGMYNKFTIKDITKKFITTPKYGLIIPISKNDELQETVLKDIYKNEYFHEEISEKIRLFYVALTRAREKMIIVAPISESDSYSHLVPKSIRLNYRSFLDILSSISITSKYLVTKKAQYTHDYIHVKTANITNFTENTKIIEKNISLEYNEVERKHISKTINKILTKEEIENINYGTKLHESLEYTNNSEELNNIKEKLSISNIINIYHEYSYKITINNIESNGIIDLMIETDCLLYIIDYKTNNIEDNAYNNQLLEYKNYIKTITNKNIKCYLYSIIENKLKEVE